MRWSAALGCFALVACNQVFGLEPTAGPDSDGDGLPDGRSDNCLIVANVDQADADGDGLGDACDPCVHGPQSGIDVDHDGLDDACDACPEGANTDEDRDGVLDGCDVCPARPDADQADADGDRVGDACDLAPDMQNTRMVFDGFDPPLPRWDTGFARWENVDGSFGPVLPLVSSNFIGAWNPDLTVPGDTWYFDTAVVLKPTAPAENAKISLDALTADATFVVDRNCSVTYANGAWYLPRTTTVFPVGSTLHLRLVQRGTVIECWLDDMLVKTVTVPPTSMVESWRPFLLTTADADFQWLDIVR